MSASEIIQLIRAEVRQAIGSMKRFPGRVVLTLVRIATDELRAQEQAAGESGGSAKPVIQPLGLFKVARPGEDALRIFEGGEPGAVILLPIGNPPAAILATLDEGDAILWDVDRVHLWADENGNIELRGITAKLVDGADTGVARIGDEIQSLAPLDTVFWTWIDQVHGIVGPPGPKPTSLTGEITTGSAVVKADAI